MVKSINDLINQPSYVQIQRIQWKESKSFDDEPQAETILFDNNNQIIKYPVRQIKIKSIKECLNGFLLESNETKTDKYFPFYLIESSLFNKFKHSLKQNKQIIISYIEERILKPEINLQFQPKFGRKICGIIINQKVNKSVLIRRIRNIFNAASFSGIDMEFQTEFQ